MGKEDIGSKQLAFAREYLKDFNATQAALRAGYSPNSPSSAAVTASRLLRNPNVRAEIAKANAKAARANIADVAELQEFWTGYTRNDSKDDNVRLKASDLLGKSQAAFVEKHVHDVNLTLEKMVLASMEEEKDE